MNARQTYAAFNKWSSLAAKLARRLTILKEHGRVWSFTCSVGIECGYAVLEAAGSGKLSPAFPLPNTFSVPCRKP